MTIHFHFDVDGAVTPAKAWKAADGIVALAVAVDVHLALLAAAARSAAGQLAPFDPGICACKLLGGGAEALHEAAHDLTVLLVDPAIARLDGRDAARLLDAWRSGVHGIVMARRALMEAAGSLDDPAIHRMPVVALERACGRSLDPGVTDAAVPEAA